VAEEFFTHEFGNGLTLVAQRMAAVASTAVAVAVPAGSSRDPVGGEGVASLACDWLLRGAGGRNTRQINDELDGLGCQHAEDAQSAHLTLSMAQLGRNLPAVLKVYADLLRRPHLSEDTFEPCRQLGLQGLDGLEDEPMRKCQVMIRERFFPRPLGRNPLGTKEALTAMAPAAAAEHVRGRLTPAGTIMGVAGAFEWKDLLDAVGALLGDWAGPTLDKVPTLPPENGITQVRKETSQAQITLAYRAVTIDKPTYYHARVAEMVLSGGMSGRLFTEVREKRGLVYSVGARYNCLKGHAGMFVYAGTSPQKAQETLEVAVGELRKLGDGITAAELARARTQLKSNLIMQGESTSARAQALAGDWYHLRRLRSLKEISDAIDATTVQDVQAYARAFPAKDFTVLTIGPADLNTAGLG
jgi:predicted Zn-dependent peptidase